ncbi:MAG: hypothetical protein L3J41_17725 [Melioribacteraceae bacterium]|nr:hypothetical protein [Melioribacteraceae bacterium]
MKKRRFCFSLRSLLVFTGVVCGALGFLAIERTRFSKERAAVQALEETYDALVWSSSDKDWDSLEDYNIPSWDFSLLRKGKTYHTVQIGDQCWFKENLDVGTMIESNSGGQLQTDNGTIEKYCYNNDASNCDTYGGLYEWNEAMQYVTTEGTQGICPTGWHIPTKVEMQTLQSYVNNQATKLIDENAKSGYTYTNETGFSALFAGHRRYNNGSFGDLGRYTNFWSSTETGSYADYMTLRYNSSDVSFYNNSKNNGFSVRCLKDSP